jgi:ribose-phosphate pyrophosphokinase
MPGSLEESISIFAPASSARFGLAVAEALGLSLAPHEEQAFDAGEHRLRPMESVRDRSVYVIQSLFSDSQGSANDRLCALLFFIGTLRDAGARHITACVPYLAYARQDRRTEARGPVTTRYVAQLFEAVGVNRVIVLEVHDPAAFDNAFRCETVRLDAVDPFVRHFLPAAADQEYAVATPDIGGAKRARHFQERLQAAIGRPVNFAFMDKMRRHGVVSGELFAGDVAGRRVIIVDDLISSATTVSRAVDACRRAGAVRVDVAATHASFAAAARRLFDSDRPDSVVVTDSIALNNEFSGQLEEGLTVLTVAPVFAEAIRQLERGCS